MSMQLQNMDTWANEMAKDIMDKAAASGGESASVSGK